LSSKKASFLCIFPRRSWPRRSPGVLKSPLGVYNPSCFTVVSATCPKNLHSSRLKCLFLIQPVRTLRKKDDSLTQNGGAAKNIRHSEVECPFSIQLLRKRLFRARLVKAKVVWHRKIHGYEHTPDQNWPFHSRVVKSLICANGKSECFCSLFGPRGVKSEQKYPDLPLAQINDFTTLARNDYLERQTASPCESGESEFLFQR